jgi:RNA-directed DNA polymerase
MFQALRATPWISIISAVRRMSPGCALRNSAHAAPDALTRRPASLYAMRLSPLEQVTYAIADAMLAGPAEPDSIVERMTRSLGGRTEWMVGLARKVVKRFGLRWDSVDRKEVSMVVAGTPGFVAAWRSDMRPVIVQVLRRAPVQRLPPPRLREVALPQVPTLGDLASWLEVEATDLEWFADCWRVMPQSAGTPLHHYSYKAIEKRDGRCRLIEVPKSRLRGVQRRILHGLLERVPPHECVHGFRKGRNTVTYAAPHAGKAVVVRFDLADFFASVHAPRVHALIRTLGYPQEVARALTALCTNRVPSARLLAPDVRGKMDWLERQRYRTRHLPQGAPTTPWTQKITLVGVSALRGSGQARGAAISADRSRGGGNRMANGDAVIGNHHLLDEQSCDALTVLNIEGGGTATQTPQERR